MKLMVLVFSLLFLSCQTAGAQSCGATTTITSPMIFTGVDVLGGGAVDTTGTLSIHCTGIVGLMQVCPSFDAGTAGANGSTSRQLQRVGGTEKINFQLYQDAARTVPWGSLIDTSLGTTPAIPITLVIFIGGTADVPVYARLFPNQQTAPPGTYTSTLATNLKFGAVSALTGCNSPLLTQSQSGPSLVVQTDFPKSCLLSVQNNVNFGTAQLLTANINAQGTLSVQCTNTTPYDIALGIGNGAGATVTARKMTGPGGAQIGYQIFRDGGRTLNWGQTVPSDTLGATGTGLVSLTPVYGRVPPQTTPGIGTYTDTLLVTLTY